MFVLSGFSQDQLYINEILSSNSTINVDPDFSAFSDWIEIYNDGDAAANISEYFLTDDLNNT